MPNFVHCGFVVSGEASEIARLKRKIFRTVPSTEAFGSWRKEGSEVVFDFNAVIPMPTDPDLDSQTWAIEHWGVKWNALDLSIHDRGSERFQFQFSTAWSFPQPVFDALSEEFPTLVFDGSAYEETDAFTLAGQINGDDDWDYVDRRWSDIGGDG